MFHEGAGINLKLGCVIFIFTDTGVRDMAQAVSRRPLSAEARIRARSSLCGIGGGQSGTGAGFLRVLWFFHVSIIPSWLFILIIWGMTNRPARGRSSETVSPDRQEQTGVFFDGKRQKAALKVLSQRDRTRNGVPGRSFSCRYN
jgi:hypothetical protein